MIEGPSPPQCTSDHTGNDKVQPNKNTYDAPPPTLVFGPARCKGACQHCRWAPCALPLLHSRECQRLCRLTNSTCHTLPAASADDTDRGPPPRPTQTEDRNTHAVGTERTHDASRAQTSEQAHLSDRRAPHTDEPYGQASPSDRRTTQTGGPYRHANGQAHPTDRRAQQTGAPHPQTSPTDRRAVYGITRKERNKTDNLHRQARPQTGEPPRQESTTDRCVKSANW
jgi:hypothetical protein